MSKRSDLLDSIVGTIGDYRKGEIDKPTPDHVDAWVAQFDRQVQVPILAEIDHVLKKTYIPKATVKKFLSKLVKNREFAGDAPCSFWRAVNFLDIQDEGNSQRELLALVDDVLRQECGMTTEECGETPESFLYLDDGIFGGYRVRNDLIRWIERDAPRRSEVNVVVIALHAGGQYWAKRGLMAAIAESGKRTDINWWRCVSVENRKAFANNSDVLWPACIPDDDLTKAYVKSLGHAPVLRKPGNVGEQEFFSSEEGRNLLEQEFLRAGVRIRSESPYLNQYQRPLGNMILESLGFGTLIVTYRNCPNNAPLALWAGDPWYPLFPRKTN